MTSALLLSARNVTKNYGDEMVVRGVSVDICAGEVVGFLGPNGAGKSTTVGMLTGTVLPTSGEIFFGELRLPEQGPQARMDIGIVTQDDNLDGEFDATDNLLMFAHHYRLRGPAARARVAELLEQVGLTSHAGKKPDELSGGLRRRLTLARALLNRPKLVFLDEPTTGLDPESRQDFWRLVAQLREEGVGVVLTTHYMDEAQRLCDRLLLMQNGSVVDEGTPQELIERVVGHEMVELEGVTEDAVRAWANQHRAWARAFGQGYLAALPHDKPRAAIVAELEALNPTRLSRRPANLEDVFLKLTGIGLD